jgi:hypothetical protein
MAYPARRLLAVVLCFCLGACGGRSGSSLPSTAPLSIQDDVVQAYTPGVSAEPAVFTTAMHVLSAEQADVARRAAAQLSDPNRTVFRDHSRAQTENVVAGGNGESVGMFTTTTFAAQGSIVNMGVQPNYVTGGDTMFYHTHQFVNNQCFEYGINYSYAAPALFAYNWCTGGNTPQGFINLGLVGTALNTWSSIGAGWMIAWDTNMAIDKISLEEIQKSDGWHLLGYNWSTKQYYDIMGGKGVTGTKSQCCGWDVFEIHAAPGANCNFDSSFAIGSHLLYDTKKQVLINGVWRTLDKVPSGGFTYSTAIDCADIAPNSGAGYASPYFSGDYYPAPAVSSFGQQYAGDWWMTQR